MEEVRLQKYLAECGIASRRKCEEFINEGLVKVNGHIAELGTKVKPNVDKVEYDGRVIKLVEKDYTYILLTYIVS